MEFDRLLYFARSQPTVCVIALRLAQGSADLLRQMLGYYPRQV